MKQDSGWGWLICFGGFFNTFLGAGYFNCGGVVLSALVDTYHVSRSEAASITTLPASCVYLFGPLSTFVCNRFGARAAVFLGAFMSTIAAITSSFATNVSLLYFTYGVCGGIGSSLLWFSSLIMVSKYFKKKISVASSLTLSGSSVGTFVLSPVIQLLLSELGLKNGFRVLACFYVLLFIPIFLYRPFKTREEGPEMEKPKWLSTHVLRNCNFMVFLIAMVLFQIEAMIPYIHLVRFAEDIGSSKVAASLLISIIAGSSLVGRLFCGCLADFDCCSRLHILQIALLCIVVGTVLVPLAQSFASLALYAAVFGFNEGFVVALNMVIIRDIVGIQHVAFALGVAYGVLAIPKTLGPLLAGFLFDLTKNYVLAFIVASACVALSSLLISFIDITRSSQKKCISLSKTLRSDDEMITCKETTV